MTRCRLAADGLVLLRGGASAVAAVSYLAAYPAAEVLLEAGPLLP